MFEISNIEIMKYSLFNLLFSNLFSIFSFVQITQTLEIYNFT